MRAIKRWRWVLVLGLVWCAAHTLHGAAVAHADDDDDGGGATLSPDLQWRLASASWDRRDYDDAASLCESFAQQNPDDPNALDALWRAYVIYHDYRPNDAKCKAMFTVMSRETVRWSKAFATSDKKRAAQGLRYEAYLLEKGVGRPAAIPPLKEMLKKYPDSPYELDAHWTLAEWAREDKRYQDAIDDYAIYVQKSGVTTENAVYSLLRSGWCYEAMKDSAGALKEYRAILEGPYPWGWGGTGWSAIDAAERAKGLGDDKLAREIGLKILDKCPDDNGGWGQIRARARTVLGITAGAKRILVYPHMLFNYSSDQVNIGPNSKIQLQRDMPVLVRMAYVSKTDPFKGTLTLTPKFEVQKDAENMKKSEGGGKTSYTADIQSPDEKGNPLGDLWYRFTEAPHAAPAPDDLVVTRKWEKAGPGWGNAIIRIQSKTRWYIYVYLPNDKTNVNNINCSVAGGPSVQPNEVRDAGKTFRWYNWYPLEQGMTIKIPIEVPATTDEYYPHIRLEGGGAAPYAASSGTGKDVTSPMKEYGLDLSSDADFAYNVEYPSNESVEIPEIVK